MATYTSNYAWTKPSGSDPVDIGVLNNNLDSQDGIMHDAFLNMADPFSESSTYAVGDIVLYGTKTYRCRVAVTTAGSWTGAANWDEHKISTLVLDNAPTDGSNNPVKSGGIYDNLVLKADKTATASGETLALVPTSEGRALIHTAYGMSVQNGTPTPSSPVDIVSAKADFTSTHGQNSATVTTDITLRAIEVTSSDAYNLVRDNKYYIADTLDYTEDDGFVVTRRIKDVEIANISSGWGYSDTGTKRTFTSISNLGFSAKTNIGISNRFILEKQLANSTWGDFLVSNYLIISLANNADINSNTDFYNWVASNPIKFYFVLATPTTESITTAQALALLGLKTYDESTTISSQAEPACTVAVEYAKERLGALALTAYNTVKGNDLRITALES